MKDVTWDNSEFCSLQCCRVWLQKLHTLGTPFTRPAASSLPILVAPPGKPRVLGAVVAGMSLLLGFHAEGVREGARGEGGRVGTCISSPHPGRRLSHLKLHATFSEHNVM